MIFVYLFHNQNNLPFDLGFLPYVPIIAKIVKVDPYEDAAKFSISPYTYTIELVYGEHHRWSIKRR